MNVLAELHADEGQGPCVVYVPGIDGSGELLLGTAPRLALDHRLVRLRYASTATTDVDPDPYGVLARSVDAVLAAAGVERALLLAESFGGAVALRTALVAPERVAALLIVNGFAYHPWRARLVASRLVAPFVRGPVFRAARAQLGSQLLLRPRVDPDAERAFRDVGGVEFDAGYRARLAMIRDLDLRPRLGEIRTPALICAADRDRIVPSLRAGRELARGLPLAELEILPNAGHLVLPLRDEPWPERVRSLLERAGA